MADQLTRRQFLLKVIEDLELGTRMDIIKWNIEDTGQYSTVSTNFFGSIRMHCKVGWPRSIVIGGATFNYEDMNSLCKEKFDELLGYIRKKLDYETMILSDVSAVLDKLLEHVRDFQ